MPETGLEYLTEQSYATAWSDERKWINKILKLAAEHPDDVRILYYPENNDGTIYAHVPKNWIKLAPPRTVNMSDERKAELAERMKSIRPKKESEE